MPSILAHTADVPVRATSRPAARRLVFFGKCQAGVSNFEAQRGLIRSAAVFPAVYGDLSPARFVWIGLAMKMRPFDTSHLVGLC
jgi:hypothetical protein